MTPFASSAAPLAVERVRHTFQARHLQVVRRTLPSPGFVRLTLAGPALAGFVSAGFDDHLKLILPQPGQERPALPALQDGRPVFPDPRPVLRDYTPARHDAAAGELDIEVALHDAGPASDWASSAGVGQWVGIAGPRGSLVIPTGFDWHWLMGDETALPAIARRLAELPAGAPVVVIAEVDGPADELVFDTVADLHLAWAHRRGAAPGTTTLLLDTLRQTALPAGDFHAWVACESSAAKALRAHLVGERGARAQWTKAAGYWRLGTADTHETHSE